MDGSACVQRCRRVTATRLGYAKKSAILAVEVKCRYIVALTLLETTTSDQLMHATAVVLSNTVYLVNHNGWYRAGN
jgi:hypothetical protein